MRAGFAGSVKKLTMGLLVCAAPLAAQAPTQNPPAGVLVLRNVTLIDGTGHPAQPNRTIIIRDGRIAEIATAQSAPPRGSRVLDLSGHFVIPGLVDAHVHLTSPFALRTQQDSLLTFLFKSGITSVRDMAGDAVVLKEHARLAADSQLPVPRVYYSALMAGAEFLRTEPRARAIAQGGTPGELAWLRGLTDTTNMKDVVAAAKDIGATGIKLYADLPAALVERVTAEAHRQGLKVWAHATLAPAKPTEVIDAGVDVISHLDMLVFEGETNLPPSIRSLYGRPNYEASPVEGPAISNALRMLQSRGTLVDATLVAVNRLGERAERDLTRPHMHPMREWSFALARRAHQLGIPFVTGTDFMGRPATDSAAALHDELVLLVTKAGLSPLQAIQAATLNGARALGREREQGSVETGKVADLVVLGEDPLVDVSNTRRVVYVIKGGHVHAIPSR